MYPNQYRHDQKLRKQRGGKSSGSSSKKSRAAKAPTAKVPASTTTFVPQPVHHSSLLAPVNK